MTATPLPDSSRRGVPRTLLALLWTVAAVVVGFIGALLLALAEPDDRALATVLATAALLAALMAVAVVTRPQRVRPWSLALSAAFVVVGLGSALVPLSETTVFVEDVLLLGGPPVVAGLLTAGVALWGRRRS